MAPKTRRQSTRTKKPVSNTSQLAKVSKRPPPRTKAATRKPIHSKNLDGPRHLSRPKPPRGRNRPLKLLENGLVSMETTPDYLIEAVQNNSTNSRLLGLPGEIRNMIFQYAVGGNEIRIQRAFANRTSRAWRDTSNSLWHGRATDLHDRRRKAQGTAFHLPEVCRQIYAETATLGYATNTFLLPITNGHSYRFSNDAPNGILVEWLAQRNAAQRSAIRSIGPHPDDLVRYIDGTYHRSFGSRLPALEEIYVSKYMEFTGYDRGSLIEKVREKDGQDVRVVFWGPPT